MHIYEKQREDRPRYRKTLSMNKVVKLQTYRKYLSKKQTKNLYGKKKYLKNPLKVSSIKLKKKIQPAGS